MKRNIIEIVLSALVLVLAIVIGYGGWQYSILDQEKILVINENLELKNQLEISLAQQAELNQSLLEQEANVRSLGEQFNEISNTVGTLSKLSQTDKELLQKYSKVFFLNEHYTPNNLVYIDEDYISDPDKPLQIHGEVWPFLKKMLARASRDDIELQILSAFRSFGEQTSLKAQYLVNYGEGANRFSADQGYSEHQLGTTIDITTPELITHPLLGFEDTSAYAWLKDNAHRYGFVLSYPENNNYYQFEPWHWRFVGTDLAQDLNRSKEYFYDLPQREIDDYLINIFD